MQTHPSRNLLLTVLLSTATLGISAGAALAADIGAVYGRSSDQSTMGEAIPAPAAAATAAADNAYGRSSETAPATQAAEESGYDLKFSLEQGAHRDDPVLVDAWPGRAAAPMEEEARWKISAHGAGDSGNSRG